MKLITILGPTSSGKTDLSIKLAHHLIKNGQKVAILSCDSRQVYKDLNLLSGKAPGTWSQSQLINNSQSYIVEEIEHFLIDFVELTKVYSLNDYIHDYISIVELLNKKVDYVLLVGGTGLFARAVTEEYQLPNMREESVASLSLSELQSKLNKDDFNNSDWNNPIRLHNRLKTEKVNNKSIAYPIFEDKIKFILKPNNKYLESKVRSRIISRIEQGMLIELQDLIASYGKTRIDSLGLECRYGIQHLEGLLTQQEFIDTLTVKTMQYIKRQNTWNNKEPNSIVITSLEDILTKLHS